MIKIIKSGKYGMRRFTCPHCGCIFEADVSEYKRIEEWIEIVCPECYNNVTQTF